MVPSVVLHDSWSRLSFQFVFVCAFVAMGLLASRRDAIVRKSLMRGDSCGGFIPFKHHRARLDAQMRELPALPASARQELLEDDMDSNFLKMAEIVCELQLHTRKLGRRANTLQGDRQHDQVSRDATVREQLQRDNAILVEELQELKAEIKDERLAREQVLRENAELRAGLMAREEEHRKGQVLQEQGCDELHWAVLSDGDKNMGTCKKWRKSMVTKLTPDEQFRFSMQNPPYRRCPFQGPPGAFGR